MLEPGVRGLGENGFEVAGAGAEGETVEQLLGSFALVEGDESGMRCGFGPLCSWFGAVLLWACRGDAMVRARRVSRTLRMGCLGWLDRG